MDDQLGQVAGLEGVDQQFNPKKNAFCQNYITILSQIKMSSYEGYFQNKSIDLNDNCFQDLQELFFQNPKHLDIDYKDKSEEPFFATNYTEKPVEEFFNPTHHPNLIQVSKTSLKDYLSTKKGQANQTMELLPNFKTFLVRKIKDLFLIKVLNKHQTTNCIQFMKGKPSFQSIQNLFHPLEKCQNLQSNLQDLFSSTELIHSILKSHIRLSEKRKMIKFVQRLRSKIEAPDQPLRWKQIKP